MQTQRFVTIFAALTALAPLTARSETNQAGADKSREAEAFRLGVEAYVYGYPLVLMNVTKQVMTNVPSFVGRGGPVNQFANMREFPTPKDKAVVSPNADTLYSIAWLDLSREPLVLHVPDTAGRYYLMPMLDAWTNVFASPGKRTTGTKEGNFAIVGPRWSGRLPRGLKEIKAPTNMVWILGRIQTKGESDIPAVNALQRKFTLTPLSDWGKPNATPSKVPIDPSVELKTPPAKQVENMDAAAFFGALAKLMIDNPPAPADENTVKRFKTIGVVPGKTFDMSNLDAAAKKGLDRAVKTAAEKLTTAPPAVAGAYENGWLVKRTGMGSYGTNYQNRAFVARIGLGANLPQDAIYPLTKVDGTGKQLNGGKRYTIHFGKGQTPPVNAFWSLTMYDMDQFFVANPINRYAIGDRDKLKFNDDGSLDICFQHESPGKDKESNWLPAPEGDFNLIMRLYWPKEAMLKGTWKVPPVVPAKAEGHTALIR